MAGKDEDRLAELYRRYGHVIFSRCRRILGDATSAQDATQEVFLRVWRHLAKAPGDREALAWIYRITTNYCLNELRRRGSAPELRETLPEIPVDQLEARTLSKDIVARLVAQLPAKLQDVGWLYHVDGLEQVEVARVLGCSRRTVINRLAAFAQEARQLMERS